MESSDFEEKALQLIQVDQEGKYTLHPEGAQFISKVPKPISVVSVAGLYRTGKSYLLNRILLNRNSGFGVGPTINPCTKGLWCWGTPIRASTSEGDKVNLIIIDSQGIGALDEDQNHDTKIFTLAILSASTFIYNSVGSIDETALQNLSLVVNLTKNIQLKNENMDEVDPEELASFFPSFLWVVRDFSLQLINSEGESISSKEYLEKALAPQKGFSDDIEEKNRIRRLLSAFFMERECITLVRPIVQQTKLQNLEKCQFDQLRSEFVEQAIFLRKKITTNAKPKLMKGEELNGQMYLSMMNSYLSAINTGSVPNIQNAWTYMCMEKCQKLLETCQDFLMEEIEEVKGSLPMNGQQLQQICKNVERQCLNMFSSEQIGDESDDYLQRLTEILSRKLEKLRSDNQRESLSYLKNYMVKNFTPIQKKVKTNQFNSFGDYLKALNEFYANLLEKGPNLPRSQIMYLEFFKKVAVQGAEYFIKMSESQREKIRRLGDEKEAYLCNQIKILKQKVSNDNAKNKEKIHQAEFQNISLKEDIKRFEKTLEQKVLSFNTEIQALTIKKNDLNQNLHNHKQLLEALQEKYQQNESNFLIKQKQSEKQRALLDLKVSQMKQELQNLRIKEKNQQISIKESQSKYNIQFKQIASKHDNKINTLNHELNNFKQMITELEGQKKTIQSKLESKTMQFAQKVSKLEKQFSIKSQMYDIEKEQFERVKSDVVNDLKNQNASLKAEIAEYKIQNQQSQRILQEKEESLKEKEANNQTQIALLKQKLEFLTLEMSENQQNYNKNIEYYESTIKLNNQLRSQQIQKLEIEKINALKNQYLQEIKQLKKYKKSLQEELKNQQQNHQKDKEQLQFDLNLQKNSYEQSIKEKDEQIQHYEARIEKIENSHSHKSTKIQQEYKQRQLSYVSKMKDLEIQLENFKEKVYDQQTQSSQKSQESLKMLKNYYEQQKYKLQQRLISQKSKFEKEKNQILAEHEQNIEEIEQQNDAEVQLIQKSLNSEINRLNQEVIQINEEKQIKEKQIDKLEETLEKNKQKIQQLHNKMQNLVKNYSTEKQTFQDKINELADTKNLLQREIITITNEKENISYQLSSKNSTLQQKIRQMEENQNSLQKMSSEYKEKLNSTMTLQMNEKLKYEKDLAIMKQENEFYDRKISELEKNLHKNHQSFDEKFKKQKQQHGEAIKNLEEKRSRELNSVQNKFIQFKKQKKEVQWELRKQVADLQKDLSNEKEKSVNIQKQMRQIQQSKNSNSDVLQKQLHNAKATITQINKQFSQEINNLKSQISQVESKRNQTQIIYEKQKTLWQNKIHYLEESKEKLKKESQQRIRSLETSLETIHKNRMMDKSSSDKERSEMIGKIEKQQQTVIQQMSENYNKKEKQLDENIRNLKGQIKQMTQKIALQAQNKQQITRQGQRKIKEFQENQKRLTNELERFKSASLGESKQTVIILEKEKENLKHKMNEKQEKYRTLEKNKQQLYYQLEKEKAKWNLERQMFQTKNSELQDIISKNKRDIQKLQHQNEKYKIEKKCNKMNISTMGKNTVDKSMINDFLDKSSLIGSLGDSGNSSLNTSTVTGKQNNPLGELSFFNQ